MGIQHNAYRENKHKFLLSACMRGGGGLGINIPVSSSVNIQAKLVIMVSFETLQCFIKNSLFLDLL